MLVPEQVFVIIPVVAVNTIATVAKLHFILLHGLVSDLNATIGGMTAKLGLLMYLSIAPLRQIHHHHHHLHHHLPLPRPRHARHIVLVRGINTVISITIVIPVLYTSGMVVFLIHIMESPKDAPI